MLEKTNGFQYYFVTIRFFCFVFINAIVFHISISERKHQYNIYVKNTHSNNCNIILDTNNKVCQLNYCCKWRYVKQCIPYILLLKNFIREFEMWFPLISHMIKFHIKIKSKPVTFFKQGYILIFKMIGRNFFTNKEKKVLRRMALLERASMLKTLLLINELTCLLGNVMWLVSLCFFSLCLSALRAGVWFHWR